MLKEKYIGQIDADIKALKDKIKGLNEEVLLLQRMKNLAQSGIADAWTSYSNNVVSATQPARNIQPQHISFSTFLDKYMDENHLSAPELANLIGYSQHTIQNWRAGKSSPQVRLRGDVANKLHDLDGKYRSEDIMHLLCDKESINE